MQVIKRFNITILDGQCLAAMSTHSTGEYVRYSDVSDLLEEKTLEQHRAEFEQWATSVGYDTDKVAGISYRHAEIARLWKAWKAAKGVKE